MIEESIESVGSTRRMPLGAQIEPVARRDAR
jgi:hypothetical protein